MAKHNRNIEGYAGSLEDLAKAVGNMTYDQTALFVEKLADDIKRQANADLGRGKIKLFTQLNYASRELYEARARIAEAWKICKPYMKDQE